MIISVDREKTDKIDLNFMIKIPKNVGTDFLNQVKHIWENPTVFDGEKLKNFPL